MDVEITMTMDNPVEGLALDISTFTGFTGIDAPEYFYDRILINVVAAEAGPPPTTAAPTGAPSQAVFAHGTTTVWGLGSNALLAIGLVAAVAMF